MTGDEADGGAEGGGLDSLDPDGREMVLSCVAAMDDLWSAERGLLTDSREKHVPRASTRYALGLLLRDGEGDRERAIDTLDAVLDCQYTNELEGSYGTWPRNAEDPPIPAVPGVWTDFDPNWREFVGTDLALIHDHFGGTLPADLADRVAAAVRRAVEGTLNKRDVPPSYTNIALKRAALVDWGGDYFAVDEWRDYAAAYAREIHELFEPAETFCEFNSPTYSGVTLNALGLWVAGARSSDVLRELGAEMEAALWRQVGEFYHAGLRRFCGPYARAYGMDTSETIGDYHVWLAAGGDDPPHPTSHHETTPGNSGAGVVAALLGTRVPDDVRPHLRSFQGSRLVRRSIHCREHAMVATAWLAPAVMLGGFSVDDPDFRRRGDQFHSGTMHWRASSERVGWGRVRRSAETVPTVEADEGALHVAAENDFVVELDAPGVDADAVGRDAWTLPGLTVDVRTDAESVGTEQVADDRVLVGFGTRRSDPFEVTLRVD